MSLVARTDAAPRATRRIAGLYAVTPDLVDTDLLTALVEAALRGGARVVQYRNKSADDTLRLEQAARLAACCASSGATLVVNDHPSLALAVDGAGLHVGSADLDDEPGALPALRRRLGPDRVLGVSCYRSVERARAAAAAGADYVAFGSLFASPTKPHAPTAPLSIFDDARRLGVSLVGIGGITSANVATAVAAGCDAAAVIADLFASQDPATVESHARALSAAFSSRVS